jgi:hypothetical protein
MGKFYNLGALTGSFMPSSFLCEGDQEGYCHGWKHPGRLVRWRERSRRERSIARGARHLDDLEFIVRGEMSSQSLFVVECGLAGEASEHAYATHCMGEKEWVN